MKLEVEQIDSDTSFDHIEQELNELDCDCDQIILSKSNKFNYLGNVNNK